MISELIYEIGEKKKFDRKFVWKLIKKVSRQLCLKVRRAN